MTQRTQKIHNLNEMTMWPALDGRETLFFK